MTETQAITFDFDAVTPRMMVDFKRETGQPLMELAAEGLDITKLDELALAGVVWLAIRMSGRPEATFDEALDTPFTALDFAESGDDEADPTPAG